MTCSARIRLTALAAALAGVWIGVGQNPPPVQLTVTKIADDLHVIVGDGGNTGVLTTDEGVILIDTKFDRSVPQILEKVKSITDKPIRYILNTHQHGDHTGGNAQLMQRTSADVFAHDNARRVMAARNMPGLPRLTFTDRGSVTLGGKTVRAYYFGRGHTDGDAFYHLPQHRVVHTGDMYVLNAPFIDASSGGSGISWPASLAGAMQLDAVTIIPGHGALSDKKAMEEWRRTFETVIERVRELQKQGKTKEEAPKLLKIDDLSAWVTPQNLLARSLPVLWDELAATR